MNRKPVITAICATYNRPDYLSRCLSCFLEQDYEGKHIFLIYNNSRNILELEDIKLPENKEIVLINNYISYKTGEEYTSLGEIYMDTLTHLSEDTELVCFMDNDDIFLPYYMSNGAKGYIESGKSAYKPTFSYLLSGNNVISKVSNNMEPSIFVSKDKLKEYGFNLKSVSHHLGWLGPLCHVGDIDIDVNGIPSMIYTWNGGVWKTSGGGESPENFKTCREKETDKGVRIISRISRKELDFYFNLVDNVSN